MNSKSLIVLGALLIGTNALTAAMVSSHLSQKAATSPQGERVANLKATASPAAPQPSPDIRKKMEATLKSVEGWNKLPANDKVFIVETMKELIQKQENAAMLKDADYYVMRLDEVVNLNDQFKKLPLYSVMKMSAVMDYDFYNGQDKEALAREVLGPQLYAANKRRVEMLNASR